MAKNKQKFYAVRQGRKTGVFVTWPECKDQIQGYSGAIYKSFSTMEEAQNFLDHGPSREKQKTCMKRGANTEEEIIKDLKEGYMIAYVDGSYDVKKHAFGYGGVTFTSEGRKDFMGMSEDKDLANFRNVAGEIFASIEAIKIAKEAGMNKLEIYHDYMGIRSWALGEWKRNNPLTQMYYEFFQSIKNILEVEFIKVDAHTGDTFNEEADKLAKQAIK